MPYSCVPLFFSSSFLLQFVRHDFHTCFGMFLCVYQCTFIHVARGVFPCLCACILRVHMSPSFRDMRPKCLPEGPSQPASPPGRRGGARAVKRTTRRREPATTELFSSLSESASSRWYIECHKLAIFRILSWNLHNAEPFARRAFSCKVSSFSAAV